MAPAPQRPRRRRVLPRGSELVLLGGLLAGAVGATEAPNASSYCKSLREICGSAFDAYQPGKPGCSQHSAELQCEKWWKSVLSRSDGDTSGSGKYGATKECYQAHKLLAASPDDSAMKKDNCRAALAAATDPASPCEAKTGSEADGCNHDCMSCDDLLDQQCNAGDSSIARLAYTSQGCSCDVENACLEQIDCTTLGVVFEIFLFVYCMAGLAIVCDDFLVLSLETLCIKWGVREDIAGASFMAFGSAAPEIIVNAVSTIKAGGSGDDSATSLGVSAIIGSGMIAFSLIPGACGLAASSTLQLKRRPLLRDVMTYSISLMLLVIFIWDGCVSLAEASFLFGLYPCYLVMLALAPKFRAKHKEKVANRPEALFTRFMDDSAEEMIRPRIRRQRSFVLEVQAEEAAALAIENQELIEATFSEDEIFNMRNAFQLFVTTGSDGKCNRKDLWRILQVLGEQEHAPADGEAIMSKIDTEDDKLVDFTEFCLAMTKRGEEEPLSAKILEVIFTPLELAFKYTCPPCEYESSWEAWYPFTFLVSFVWVSFFSTIVSAVVTRWVTLLNVPPEFFGLVLISVGAEIPDTIQSVTCARKGYGSMAVSNGLGSQICNILVGLGLPWTLSNLAGHPIVVTGHKKIEQAATLQGINVAINFSMLLGAALVLKQNKAQLGRTKGFIFLATYFVILTLFALTTFVAPKIFHSMADPCPKALECSV